MLGTTNTSQDAAADKVMSPTRQQAAEVLRRARQLPVGPNRNDLRQVAIGLIWLDKKGLAEKAFRHIPESTS
jgi:hypothetical protein